MKSTVMERDLERMVADLVLPKKALIGWRATNGELFPTANTGEVVVFEPFFIEDFPYQPVDFSEVFFVFMRLTWSI